MWELKTGDIVSTGRAHSSPVANVSWAPDEKQLVSASSGVSLLKRRDVVAVVLMPLQVTVALDGALCVWNFYLA